MLATDGLPIPQRYWAVLATQIALTIVALDGTIANVALPVIARDLQADASSAIWVVNSYQLAIIVTLLPFSSLGDIFSYRRIYWAGLVLFTLGSLASALSHSIEALIAARFLQGLGAGAVMAVHSALLRYIYPSNLLGRGIGWNALNVAISGALGPTVASAVLSLGNWQWLFGIAVPVGVVSLAVAAVTLPRTPSSDHKFDWVSALFCALAFGLSMIGIDGAAHDEDKILVIAELAGAVVSGTILVRRQLDHPFPLLPLDLLRLPIFRLSLVISTASFFAQMSAYIALPFYFQDVLGKTAVATGLLMTPWLIATAAAAMVAGRLADRYSAGLLGALGLGIFAIGMGSAAMMPAHPSTPDIVWRMILCGIGFGLFQSPNNRAIMSSAPPKRSGGAGGMISVARLIGQTTGAAAVALVFGRFAASGTTIILSIGSGLALLGAAVSVLRITASGSEAKAGTS